MHPQTGAIATFETEQDAKSAGYSVKLDLNQFNQFRIMNRHDRLAELSKNRKRKRIRK